MSGRLAMLTGAASVVLTIVGFVILGDTPDVDESPQKLAEFWKDNDGAAMGAGVLTAWAAVLFLIFAGALRNALRVANPETEGLATAGLAGAIVFTVGLALFGAISFTLGDAPEKYGPDTIQVLNAMNEDFFFPGAVGGGVFLISTGLAIAKSGLLPAALGWIGLVIGVIALTPLGFFGFMALGIWTLVVSVMLALRATGTGAGTAAPA